MAKKKVKRPTEGAPGDKELQHMCDSARKVKEACDALGFEFRGSNHFIALMEGAMRAHVPLAAMIEDPDNRPYIWDIHEDDHHA